MKEENVLHKYNEVLLSHKNKGNPVICDKMDGSGGHHASKISRLGKDERCRISFVCGLTNRNGLAIAGH